MRNNKMSSPKLLMFLCWLVYTSAYLGRYSYNANINSILSFYGVTHADAGLVVTCFFFSYGAGQIINGIFCKYYNKRYIISICLIVSALLNLIVFCGIDFILIKYLWLLNGILQSVFWSSLVDVLCLNLKDDNDIEKSILIMSTPVAVGTFIVYGLSALFTYLDNYNLIFLVASVVLLIVGIVWFVFVGNYNVLSLPNKDAIEKLNTNSTKQNTILKFLPLILILCFFAIVNNLIKDGLGTWVPSILKENYGFSDSLSILLTLILPMLGILGATLNSFVVKYLKNPIAICSIYFLISSLLIFGIVIFTKTIYSIPIIIIFGVITLLMHAVNNIITNNTPLYLRDKINSGFLAGLLNGFCYVGSTISSYGLGTIADNFGWDLVFNLFLIIAIVTTLLGISILAIKFIANKMIKNK